MTLLLVASAAFAGAAAYVAFSVKTNLRDVQHELISVTRSRQAFLEAVAAEDDAFARAQVDRIARIMNLLDRPARGSRNQAWDQLDEVLEHEVHSPIELMDRQVHPRHGSLGARMVLATESDWELAMPIKAAAVFEVVDLINAKHGYIRAHDQGHASYAGSFFHEGPRRRRKLAY